MKKKTLPHRLGRIAHRDNRDMLLSAHLPRRASLPASKLWPIAKAHLDQGDTGTCVGHGWRNFLRCAPVRTSRVKPSAFDIYRSAVLLDPWRSNDGEANLPDGDPGLDSGTTVRAGAKAVAAMGDLTSYVWAFSLQPALEWLLTRGPVVVGVNWYESMFNPDPQGHVSVAAGSSIAGGHCFLVRGANQKSALATCTNSWGDGWANGGDFTLSFKDLERLILEDGEVCTAIQTGTK